MRHCGVDRPLRSQNCRITFEFLREYFFTGSAGKVRGLGRTTGLTGAGREARSSGAASGFDSAVTGDWDEPGGAVA